jgi:NTP pyrophosphatase (non-canonical NTP hydrolase)
MNRHDLETAAVLLVGKLAARQLGLPKNRAKGTPTETPAQLVRMAQDELDEVLHALRTGAPIGDVLAELGDAAAFIGLAAVAVRELPTK